MFIKMPNISTTLTNRQPMIAIFILRSVCQLSNGITYFDSGNEVLIHKLLRKMRALNYVPSQFGSCNRDAHTTNIPLSRIVADSMFIDSSKDYFIQVVDFIAYAVKTKYDPSVNAKAYRLENSYDILEPIVLKQATKDNVLGIVIK